jgi:hypothetical protein
MSKFDEWHDTYDKSPSNEAYQAAQAAWNAAKTHYLDAAAKVAREWNWRISADDICQDCSNVASEEIAAAIERLKE